MNAPIIVIGAGLAAWTCVRELRKLEASAGLAAAPITVVTGDSGDFYAKPSLSNAFAQSKSPAQLVTTPAAVMAQKMSVTLLAHTQVHAIDTALRTISTDAGPLAYCQLVMRSEERRVGKECW